MVFKFIYLTSKLSSVGSFSFQYSLGKLSGLLWQIILKYGHQVNKK